MALSAHVAAHLSAVSSPAVRAPSKSVRSSGTCPTKRVVCASAVARKQQQEPAEPVMTTSPLAAVGKAAATAAVASSCAALLMMPLHGLFPADAMAAEAAKAVAVLSGSAGVEGVVAISQEADSPSTLTVKITGLTPGKHGFHLHKFGDTTKGCISTGPHFNPAGLSHGGPEDSVRHAGDLGNIVANADGVAETTISDSQIALSGPNSALGRAFVVHELEDDLGKGGAELSLSTGNAGGRLACGVVALAAN